MTSEVVFRAGGKNDLRGRFVAGYRRYQWHDGARDRPVWADVWYPAAPGTVERTESIGLGVASSATDAELAAADARWPLVVFSPGASGSPSNYTWITERLARSGWVVLGVSPYAESWIYGADSVHPAAVTRLWMRPPDCSFALTQFANTPEFSVRVDHTRVVAMGHSSGGATAIGLLGGVLDPEGLMSYCASAEGALDRGCKYSQRVELPFPDAARQSYRDSRVVAAVLMDPAGGPAYRDENLAAINAPVLVIGATDNDFLPFEHHAGRYAAKLPNARLIRLDHGEGHFVFLNPCDLDLVANGVALCVDRPGVDRNQVHDQVAQWVIGSMRQSVTTYHQR